MPSTEKLAPEPETPSMAPRLYGVALLVGVIMTVGFWLVNLYTEIDLVRDTQTWREKLNLVAESRTSDVNKWVNDHFKELRTLADNPSLQLYLTELQTMPEQAGVKNTTTSDTEPAQKTYLRNLVLFTADRSGFSSPSGIEAIRANVQKESKNGMAVLNNNNEVVVSTSMAGFTRDEMIKQAAVLEAGQQGFIDIQKDDEGTLYIGFIVPIFSIQGEHNAESQIGKVVGIKTVDSNLFGLLKHPGITEQTLETILIRSYEGSIEYLSPLQDGTAALSRQSQGGDVAESTLLASVGDFTQSAKDYRDKPVLGTSRAVPGTPWVLVVKIDRSEALADGNQRRASMTTFFALIIMAIILIIVAGWWYAHSKRAMMMSLHFRRMAARARAQEQLLRLVSDNQPEPIYIVDAAQTYHFANKKTAEVANMTLESIAGKTLNDIRGTARAEQISEQCKKALTIQQTVFDLQHTQEGAEDKVVRSAYVPLAHIPVASLPEPTPGVLVVEQDISEVVHEREQRLDTQYQLVNTLVKLVDKRDPFAANHSLLVSHVAFEIANEMELDNITVSTTRTAGCLMNIGKIIVPTELLTKSEALNAREKDIIRESMTVSADLVKDISFDGPVGETLRQWQEKWDGTGPLGLSGEAILISARIIAVANAFIGMISPRSWRTAIPIESANKFLLEQADTHFDRRVVIALVNYVENHSGKAWLKQILESQQKVA